MRKYLNILFGGMLMLSLPVQATEGMVSIVRDLLLLEAEQARHNMAACSGPEQGLEGVDLAQPSMGKNRSGKPFPGLKLKAVYGRDTQLLAEVQHEQRLLVFQQGQLWPIGRERDRQMRLLSLDSRCIELEIGLPPDSSLSVASDQVQPSQSETQSIKLCLPS